jgi:hypothetical protein
MIHFKLKNFKSALPHFRKTFPEWEKKWLKK